MSLFLGQILLTKCHFLMGCSMIIITARLSRIYEQQAALDSHAGANCFAARPIKKKTAVSQKTAHKETSGKDYNLPPTIFSSRRRCCA